MSKRMALLVTGATPQAAFAPWMMAATGAAMEYECALFYAFDGLDLLRPQPVVHGALPASGAMMEPAALRALCVEQGVRLMACSASLEMRGMVLDDLMPGVELAGMASWLAYASGAEIQLNFA